jgi:fructosamine-3-kinase
VTGFHEEAASWRREVQEAMGFTILSDERLSGGDIGTSYRVCLENDLTLFVKRYPHAPRGIAESEVDGLRWLAGESSPYSSAQQTLRIAAPRAVGHDWLVLEWIESASPCPDYAHALGRGLAALHARPIETFGHTEHNWLAGLPQDNTQTEAWSEFYGERRLRPLVRRACDESILPRGIAVALEQLIEELPMRVGDDEPPAPLHGDLWSGNVMTDDRGLPCLIDPAVYAGHREVDLAMMRLFGGFPEATFDAYHEAYPLSGGWAARVPLYQLYPLLVHVNLFGLSYLSQLEAAVRRTRAA